MQRTGDYRGQQVHDWGFPVIERMIPRRLYFAEWLERLKEKGLGAIAAFLMRRMRSKNSKANCRCYPAGNGRFAIRRRKSWTRFGKWLLTS